MSKIFILILLILMPFGVSANNFIEKNIFNKKVRIVEYDKKSKLYDIKIIKSESGGIKLDELLSQNGAITGVNGIFFCPTDYAWCNTNVSFTNNERYIKGQKTGTWDDTGDRVVFGWDKDKNTFLFQTNKINPSKEKEIYYGFANYPLLLKDGQNALEQYYDKGLIDYKMINYQTRNFICSDKTDEHIYFGLIENATLDDLINVLVEFGCYNALNLDAGFSTSFIYNGKYLVGPPKRGILDAVAIVPNFDTTELDKKSIEISQKIYNFLKNKSPEKKSSYLKSFLIQLNDLKNDIYNKNSSTIYEKDFTGELQKNGYKIEINDEKTLKKIYLVNKVYENIKKY